MDKIFGMDEMLASIRLARRRGRFEGAIFALAVTGVAKSMKNYRLVKKDRIPTQDSM